MDLSEDDNFSDSELSAVSENDRSFSEESSSLPTPRMGKAAEECFDKPMESEACEAVSLEEAGESFVISDDFHNIREDSEFNNSPHVDKNDQTPTQVSDTKHQLPAEHPQSTDRYIPEEGQWREDDSVPDGWMVRQFKTKIGQNLEQIKSPTGMCFRGRKGAVEWMKEQGSWSKKDVDLMQKKLKINWIDDDPAVPTGWKIRNSQIMSRNGKTKMQWFMSPNGEVYRGRKAVLKDIKVNSGKFGLEVLKKFKSASTMPTKFSTEYDWSDIDQTIPQGWRSATIKFNSFGRTIDSWRFLSPDGRFFRSRIEVLKDLLEDGTGSAEDFDRLKCGLVQEGWETDPFLPLGWFMKADHNKLKRKGVDYKYLSENFQLLKSTTAAIAVMKDCGFSDEVVNGLVKRNNDEGKKLNPDKYDWLDGDETVPEGWKIRTLHCSNGVFREFFMAPDGTGLSGRKQAVKFMKKGSFEAEDIRRMEGVNKFNWLHDPTTLPLGWRMRSSDIQGKTGIIRLQCFLDSEGKLFRGRKAALDEIQNSGKFSSAEIRNFKFVIPEEKRRNYDWKENDPSVPMGWLTTLVKVNSFGKKMVKSKRFLAPCGRFCWSREEALKYMLKEGIYMEEEIDIMQAGFAEDNENEELNLVIDWKDTIEENGFSTKRSPKYFGNWANKHLKKETKDMDWEPGMNVSETGKAPKKQKLDVKSEPSVSEQFVIQQVEEDNSDEEYVPKLRITKVKREIVLDAENILSPRHQEICKAENDNLMLSPSTWNEDDSTVPEGWKSRTSDIKTSKGSFINQWFLSPEGQVFRSRKSALKFIELEDDYSKEAVRLFKSKPTTMNKFTKDYEWNENDPSVPLGWKSVTVDKVSFGKIVESRRFLAPDGHYCVNRLDALKYMVKEDIFSLEDINVMKSGLLSEGWKMDLNLPEGWYMRKKTDKINAASYQYIADDFQKFESTKAAIKYMKESNSYSLDDVSKLKDKIASNSKKVSHDKYKWLEDEDTLPPGWKNRIVSCSNGLDRQFFLSPDGSNFSGRKQAIDYMIKNDFSRDDVKIMESVLDVQWLEDDPSLPAGWKMRITDMKTKAGTVPMQWFCSPEGKVLRGRKSALAHIMKSGLYNKDDVRRFRCSGDNVTKSQYQWEEEDPSVPYGWKTTLITMNSFGKNIPSKRFLSPDGKFCHSRIDALKFMKKENFFLKEDLEKMKLGLIEEGWESNTLLPPGWLVKTAKHKENEVVFKFFASDFTLLKSFKAAKVYLKSNSHFTLEDVDKLSSLVDVGRKKFRQQQYLCSKSDATVPQGWKVKLGHCNEDGDQKMQILAPDGSIFLCRRSALQHMVREVFAEEEIEDMRNCLKYEGWEDESLLPIGWKLRKNSNKRNEDLGMDYSCMSREGEILNSLKSVFELMEKCNVAHTGLEENKGVVYTEDEIGNMKILFENKSKQVRQQKYIWEDNNPTVPAGWKTRTVEGMLVRNFFLSPDGSSFNCRRSGLQYMIKETFSQEEINAMREMLVHEGWESEAFLPQGWKVRKKEGATNGVYDVDYWYLSVEGLLFKSTKTAVQFMTESKNYNQQDIDLINKNLELESRMIRQQKYDWIEGDPTVPISWRIREVEGKVRRTFFLSEDGTQFACRRSAYQHMIKESYSESQVLAMSECLVHEGWEEDELLPKGWKVRKIEGSNNGKYDVSYCYISTNGTMLKSIKAVINYLKESPEFGENDILKMKTMMENESKKSRGLKHDWLVDENLPLSWKYRSVTKQGIRVDYILTPGGDQIRSRKAVIEFMIDQKFRPAAILKVWSTLNVEGWVADTRLPQGWRVRSEDRLKNSSQFYFLSPQMKLFKSIKTVLSYLSSESELYSNEDVEKVKSWIEEQQVARRGKFYNWNIDNSLPAGWKMRTVTTKRNKVREFFLTKDGEHISGRKKAIQVMKDKRIFDKKEIEKMVSELNRVIKKNTKKRPIKDLDDDKSSESASSKDLYWDEDDSASQDKMMEIESYEDSSYDSAEVMTDDEGVLVIDEQDKFQHDVINNNIGFGEPAGASTDKLYGDKDGLDRRHGGSH